MSLQLGGCTEGDLCKWGDGKAYHIRDVGMLLDLRCCVNFFLMDPGRPLGDGGAVFLFFFFLPNDLNTPLDQSALQHWLMIFSFFISFFKDFLR